MGVGIRFIPLPMTLDGDVEVPMESGMLAAKLAREQVIGPDLNKELSQASVKIFQWRAIEKLLEVSVDSHKDDLKDLEGAKYVHYKQEGNLPSGIVKATEPTIDGLVRNDPEVQAARRAYEQVRVMYAQASAGAEAMVKRHQSILKMVELAIRDMSDFRTDTVSAGGGRAGPTRRTAKKPGNPNNRKVVDRLGSESEDDM